MTNNQFNVLRRLAEDEEFSTDFTSRYSAFGVDGTVLRSMLYHDYIEITAHDVKLIHVGHGRMREVPNVHVMMTVHGAVAYRDELARRASVELNEMEDEYIEDEF